MDYTTSNTKGQELLKKIAEKKGYNEPIIEVLQGMREYSRAAYIKECGTFVELSKNETDVRITNANFCRQRLCNVCAWRRQAKYYSQMLDVDQVLYAQGYTIGDFYFMTLTVKNCYSSELNKTLNGMLKGWDRFLHYKYIKSQIMGYVRAIEVTYNENTNQYHPHIHIVLCAKKSAKFKADRIAELWKKALKLDYTPVIDIRPCTSGTQKEVLKYSLKYKFSQINNETVSTYLYSLHGRRLISFGGVYAEIRKALKQCDFENDLLDIPADLQGNPPIIIKEHYLFNVSAGAYELIKE